MGSREFWPQDFYDVRTFLKCPYNNINFEVRVSWKIKLFSQNLDVSGVGLTDQRLLGSLGAQSWQSFWGRLACPAGMRM